MAGERALGLWLEGVFTVFSRAWCDGGFVSCVVSCDWFADWPRRAVGMRRRGMGLVGMAMYGGTVVPEVFLACLGEEVSRGLMCFLSISLLEGRRGAGSRSGCSSKASLLF